MMIIVTGATGQLGSRTVKFLLERVPAEQIGVSVQNLEKARDLSSVGVRVRHGDFEDAATLASAFEGATQVFIVPAPVLGEAGRRQRQTAIEAAKAAGAQRILYASHMAVSPHSLFPPMLEHADAEAKLQESGVAFTSLRNGFYASSGLNLLGKSIETGELAAPADGPVCWTTHDDLAEASAIVLANENKLDSLTRPLTGAETFDLGELAAIASEITGRLIKRTVVSDDEYRAMMLERGTPEQFVNIALGLFVASRQGEFAKTDPLLEEVLGHKPTTMRDAMKAALSK